MLDNVKLGDSAIIYPYLSKEGERVIIQKVTNKYVFANGRKFSKETRREVGCSYAIISIE
jgi:hypothetical protein